jgi:hypothetical protein
MNDEQLLFLDRVKKHSKDPEMFYEILRAATDGIYDLAIENQKKAADMETVAAMVLNTKLFAGQESYIAQLLDRWKNKAALNWDDQIDRLKKG